MVYQPIYIFYLAHGGEMAPHKKRQFSSFLPNDHPFVARPDPTTTCSAQYQGCSQEC